MTPSSISSRSSVGGDYPSSYAKASSQNRLSDSSVGVPSSYLRASSQNRLSDSSVGDFPSSYARASFQGRLPDSSVGVPSSYPRGLPQDGLSGRSLGAAFIPYGGRRVTDDGRDDGDDSDNRSGPYNKRRVTSGRRVTDDGRGDRRVLTGAPSSLTHSFAPSTYTTSSSTFVPPRKTRLNMYLNRKPEMSEYVFFILFLFYLFFLELFHHLPNINVVLIHHLPTSRYVMMDQTNTFIK
jgi:hypothetical protein